MFTETELALPVLVGLGVSVLLTDFLWRKIFNAQTLPWILLGPVAAGLSAGGGAVLQSVLGVLMGLGLFGFPFHKGYMGGGDVKYLMALGALGGYSYALHCALLSILIGGGFAFLILLFGGRLPSFWDRARVYLYSWMVPGLKKVPMEIDRSHSMPMGPALALSSVWVLLDNPLVRYGGLS